MTTLLQKKMLIRIAHSEFTPLNGAPPTRYEDAQTWASAVILTPADKGVITSMINAGLVVHCGEGHDAGIALTELGFREYLKAMEN